MKTIATTTVINTLTARQWEISRQKSKSKMLDIRTTYKIVGEEDKGGRVEKDGGYKRRNVATVWSKMAVFNQ